MITFSVKFSPDTYTIRFQYRNWKGETAVRHGRPVRMFFGSTEWHSEPQWLMEMVDIDKNETRIFAMRDMTEVLDETLVPVS